MSKGKMREMVYRIKALGIYRRYGFRDGSYVTVGLFYKNGRPVKDAKDIVFAERSDIAEKYCLACGIKQEDQMDQLKGKQVHVDFEVEDSWDMAYLTRPIGISKEQEKPEFERIISVALGPVADTEEEDAA